MRTNKINVIALVSMDLLLHFGLLYIVSINSDIFYLFIISMFSITFCVLFYLFSPRIM